MFAPSLLVVVLFSVAAAGDLRAAVKNGDLTVDGERIEYPSDPSFDDEGNIAFLDGISLYVARGEKIVLVARVGQEIEGVGTVASIGRYPLLRAGRVAFWATGEDGVPHLLLWEMPGLLGSAVITPQIRAGDDVVLVPTGAVATEIRGEIALNARGNLLVHDVALGPIWIDNSGSAAGRYVILPLGSSAQGVTGRADSTWTAAAFNPRSLDDADNVVLAVVAQTPGGAESFTYLARFSAGKTFGGVIQPALDEDERWAAQLVSMREGTAFLSGSITSPTAPVQGFWEAAGATPTPVYTFPVDVGGVAMTGGGAFAPAEPARFFYWGLREGGGNAVVWWDGADARVVYVPGQAPDDRPTVTADGLYRVFVGGHPRVFVFDGSCNGQPGVDGCQGAWKYDTRTNALTTLVMRGDTIDLGENGEGRVGPVELCGTNENGDSLIRVETSAGVALLTDAEAPVVPTEDEFPNLTVAFGDPLPDSGYDVAVTVTNLSADVTATAVQLRVEATDARLSSACARNGESELCDLGALAPGQSVVTGFDYDPKSTKNAAILTATVAGQPGELDPSDNTATYDGGRKDGCDTAGGRASWAALLLAGLAGARRRRGARGG